MSEIETQEETMDGGCNVRSSDLLCVDDNFGSNQMLADILPQCRMVDIRVRLNGKFYWFDGSHLKHILKHVKYNQIDNDGIKSRLEDHAEQDA